MQVDRLLAGAMSGTSADGVDVAITRIAGQWPRPAVHLLHHHHRPYQRLLRDRVFAVRSTPAVTLGQLADLGRGISLTYAAAVNEALCAANLSAEGLHAVAVHGQTLYHAPPETIQWIDPALVAGLVGCPVVSDFRRADCAAGGQGAPLVPLMDYVIFGDSGRPTFLLNLGGIANVTYLPAEGGLEKVIAFDTGPGNCISDYLCRRHEPDGPGFDAGGRKALAGRAHPQLVGRALEHAYFQSPPPKSTDGPAMIGVFEHSIADMNLTGRLSLEDLLATAALVTSRAIIDAIRSLVSTAQSGRCVLIASGGGVENAAIRAGLAASGLPLSVLDDHGIPSQAKEAMAFALLGAATLDGIPGNVIGATGARRRVVLGAVTPRP